MVNLQQQFKCTRIAPTPSGYLHLGNAFSFALTASLANINGADILLRIDDLDQQRANPDFINDIFDTLAFLGISYQQGPADTDDLIKNWSQAQRLSSYNAALNELKLQNALFACLCSRSQLQAPGYQCSCLNSGHPLDTPGAAWRLETSTDISLSVQTYEQGPVKVGLPHEMYNFIVRKKDGFPAYQLTSLIDDIHFETDFIVRGTDLWPSTIAQHYLANVLGHQSFGNVTFHHHELLKDNEDAKLSKSAGATSIRHLKQQGFTAAQVYALIEDRLKAQNSHSASSFTNFSRR